MKRMHILFLSLITLFMVFAVSDYAQAAPDPAAFIQEEETEQPSFILPAFLQIIGDEAFEGTALQSAELPESVTEIGERAFANNDNLLVLRLPNHIKSIGKDILAGSKQAALAVYAGSDALDQILGTDCRFFIIASISEKRIVHPEALIAGTVFQTVKYEQKSDTCPVVHKGQRTGRTGAELKAEQYRGIAALYIQSRYFP